MTTRPAPGPFLTHRNLLSRKELAQPEEFAQPHEGSASRTPSAQELSTLEPLGASTYQSEPKPLTPWP
jgi:hypothetical protein